MSLHVAMSPHAPQWWPSFFSLDCHGDDLIPASSSCYTSSVLYCYVPSVLKQTSRRGQSESKICSAKVPTSAIHVCLETHTTVLSLISLCEHPIAAVPDTASHSCADRVTNRPDHALLCLCEICFIRRLSRLHEMFVSAGVSRSR